MADACPLQTPLERERGHIIARADIALLETVRAAVAETNASVIAALRATGLDDPAPLDAYFLAGLHQKLYCLLCGADPETFAGGNPKAAVAILRNAQQIARHHWGADIAPHPRPSEN